MQVLTFKDVKNIVFPVYVLPSDNIELVDGLLMCDNELVDDTNMPGETIGIRRAQTHFNLMKLNKQIIGLNGILKQSKPYFIDTLGRPFIYQKTKFCALKYYKIKRVDRKGTHSLLWLYGINFPINIPRPPASEMMYAGMLHYHELPWTLYEYSTVPRAGTRKKV